MTDEIDENFDSSNETEETVQPEDTTTEDGAESETEVDVAQLQATNKKLFERAKKAELELKKLKPQAKPTVQTPQSASPTVEETVLLANGMDEELLGQLKKVAQVQGISLIKAQADSIFVAIKEKFEKEKKQQSASMGASRGSGTVKPKPTFKSEGLSREEHMAMVKSL